MVQVIIGALVGLIGGGIVTAVIQATVLKNRKNQTLREAELEAEAMKKRTHSSSERKVFEIKGRTRRSSERP